MHLHIFGEGIRCIEPQKVPTTVRLAGHGGADFFLVNEFIQALMNEKNELMNEELSSVVRSQKLVFVARKSRVKNSIVNPNVIELD